MTARSPIPSRPISRLSVRALLLVVVALALAAPTTAVAEQSSTTPAGKPAETTPASPSPAPATPAPAAPAPTPPATPVAPPTPTPTPAPSTGAPGVASAPKVQGERSQGNTPSRPDHAARAHGKSNAGGREPARSSGGSSPASRQNPIGAAGPHSAAKPSALTPPLPLTLGPPITGVSSFFIESFRIPPFLLPIFQAAGSAYGVPWQVLAAINEVETDYGRDLSISSAGAEGWMQFLPSSWAQYGVDANGDGFKDPYNPADAIFAAARYLRAAGAARSIRGAVFSYNHSQAYVDSVILRARLLGGTPPELLGAITGLTEARFPVHAASHFSDGFPTVPATVGGSAQTLAGTTIYSTRGAPVIAVQDGQIVQIGASPTLGRFVSLRDPYGNTYTYAQLGSVAKVYPLLKLHGGSSAGSHAAQSGSTTEPRPSGPASAGAHPGAAAPGAPSAAIGAPSLGAGAGLESPPASPSPLPASPPAGSPSPPTGSPSPPAALSQPAASPPSPPATSTPWAFRVGTNDVYLRPLRRGAQVIAGTVLGHLGAPTPQGSAASSAGASAQSGAGSLAQAEMLFQIRPAGRGAPLIDPKPILDGWVRLESTSIFRAKGENPFLASAPTVGQVLLESKEQLEQQVLHDPTIGLYPCGRQDIQSGQIDRRVLATLELLAVSGLKPTVSALKCGHSELTSTGSISEHSTGDAVDISAINGIPIAGHQGAGSITDTTIRKLLTLQGSMKPHQIISLMSYPGTDNTLSMADHYNHIHVGFTPLYAGDARIAGAFSSAISPSQWIKLIARLGEIPDPEVESGHSAASIPVPVPAPRGSASGKRARGHR